MQHRLAETLMTDLAPLALATVRRCLGSADERVAVAAAKLVLEKTVASPKSRDVDDGPTDISNMSQAQLHELIVRLEGELSDRARDVTPAPDWTFMH